MRTAAICPTCATYINALCVIYDGPGLTNINVAPLDNLDDILKSINDNLVPISGAGAPTGSAIYKGQIYIDNSTGDVYIAITTGGGAGDWDELALQSAIPPTPSLNDVLTISNNSTVNINIQNTILTPTTITTVRPSGILTVNPAGTMTLGYNSIAFLNVASTFTATVNAPTTLAGNVSINLPNASGTIALLSDIPSGTYKKYVAKISQTGITAPTVDYLYENTMINPVTFTYDSPGYYKINCTDFSLAKTVVFFQQGSGTSNTTFQLNGDPAGAWINMFALQSALFADGTFQYSSLEIRVYP